MKRIITIIISLSLFTSLFAQQDAIPYTLADRDRLIRVEAEVQSIRFEMNSLRSEVDTKIDSIHQRIDDQQALLYMGFSLIFGVLLFLLGFNIWDRRTMLTPLKQQQDKTLEALKEMAKKDSNIKEALKKASLW